MEISALHVCYICKELGSNNVPICEWLERGFESALCTVPVDLALILYIALGDRELVVWRPIPRALLRGKALPVIIIIIAQVQRWAAGLGYSTTVARVYTPEASIIP